MGTVTNEVGASKGTLENRPRCFNSIGEATGSHRAWKMAAGDGIAGEVGVLQEEAPPSPPAGLEKVRKIVGAAKGSEGKTYEGWEQGP